MTSNDAPSSSHKSRNHLHHNSDVQSGGISVHKWRRYFPFHARPRLWEIFAYFPIIHTVVNARKRGEPRILRRTSCQRQHKAGSLENRSRAKKKFFHDTFRVPLLYCTYTSVRSVARTDRNWEKGVNGGRASEVGRGEMAGKRGWESKYRVCFTHTKKRQSPPAALISLSLSLSVIDIDERARVAAHRNVKPPLIYSFWLSTGQRNK